MSKKYAKIHLAGGEVIDPNTLAGQRRYIELFYKRPSIEDVEIDFDMEGGSTVSFTRRGQNRRS